MVIEQLLNNHIVKSISLDNGSEFSEFRVLEENLKAPVYFAEPHKPWQRGTNENTNDILRFFFPKGYDFRQLTQAQLKENSYEFYTLACNCYCNNSSSNNICFTE